MKQIYLLILLLLPIITNAQTASLQTLISGIGGFINTILIPFILGIAFLIFLINAVRFFVIGGDNQESQENAKGLALYGIGAFVMILSFWGLVNILSNGIGLNEGPCIDGTSVQSDYIDSDAPCSSIKPLPRPARPTNPGSDPINPIPNGTAPSTTLPNNVSFTPQGNPVAYTPVAASQTEIRTAANSYLNKDLETTYGANAALVRDALFADLHTTQSTAVTEINRLRAAYRLRQAGVIDESTLIKYVDAVSKYQTTVKDPDIISYNAISNISQPLPSAVTANINSNKAAITSALIKYNASADFANPINTQNTVAEIFDTTQPAKVRLAKFMEIYNHPGNPLNDYQYQIRDEFLANYNTENAFAGVFKPEF